MDENDTKSLLKSNQLPLVSAVDWLAQVPEEEVWLASQKSVRTREAYRKDVAHFLKTLGITRLEQLRTVDH